MIYKTELLQTVSGSSNAGSRISEFGMEVKGIIVDKKVFQISYFDLIILKLLKERDMYGYEILEQISLRSENVYDIKAGTLYPILASLTEQGFVEPYEKHTEQKRVRKYYRITSEGIQAFNGKKENWKAYCRLINGLLEG